MKTYIRKSLGVVVVAASLLAVLALRLSGTPLVSVTSWHSDSSADGFITFGGFEVHWPLLAACAAGALGLVAIAWPERRPPKLQQ
ncbi:MAG TPA: hypothetical protein VMU04_06215 [Candidatus Acidoferrum sp.]|nr:hypothetical protein [Candidatus Acidoferrum sp.]